MQDMTIQDIMNELEVAKHNFEQADAVAKSCKQELEVYRNLAADKLAELGLKTAKGDNLTLSLVEKPSFRVTDPDVLIEWLNEEPTIDPRQYIRLDARAIDSLAKEARKKTGEILPGGQFITTESLSVREAK